LSPALLEHNSPIAATTTTGATENIQQTYYSSRYSVTWDVPRLVGYHLFTTAIYWIRAPARRTQFKPSAPLSFWSIFMLWYPPTPTTPMWSISFRFSC
jgi:hypothetical protein